MRIAPIVGAILLCLSLAGCGANRGMRINPAYPKELQTKSSLSRDQVLDKVKDVTARNQAIETILVLINQNYRDYKSAIYEGRATFDTVNDLVLLGITGMTTTMGTAATKTALGAVSTGLIGAKASVDKNFFANASRDALFAKMDALREAALTTILQNEKKDFATYSMQQAFRDLDDYYAAGTVIEAVQAISATSGQEKKESKEVNKAITAQ